jgi:hypothetical protein
MIQAVSINATANRFKTALVECLGGVVPRNVYLSCSSCWVCLARQSEVLRLSSHPRAEPGAVS